MRSLQFISLAITIGACSTVSAQCPTGDVLISSLADLNDYAMFYGSCDTLPGDLIITGPEAPIDHTVFANLKMITGDLRLQAIPPGAPDLTGYDQLTHIGGDLWLNSLPQISLNGLGALQRIDGELRIEFVGINNFTGLSSLSVIGGDLTLMYAPEVTSFNGLNQLDSIYGSVIAEGLENTSFTTITVPPDLKYVGGQLRIMANHATSMNGGNSLDRVNEGLYVSGPMLQSISGMNDLNYAGELVFQHLPVFTSINAFSGLDTVQGYFQLYDTPLLFALSGFPELDLIGGSMWISGNSLTSITGFPQLDSIGTLQLADIPMLQDITAFDHAISLGHLVLQDNPQLAYCHVQAICDHLLGEPAIVPNISNNATGCTTAAEIAAFCDLTTAVPGTISEPTPSIYPNPADHEARVVGGPDRPFTLRIRNAQGQELLVIERFNVQHDVIDVRSLPSGLLFIEILDQWEYRTIRLLNVQ